MVIKERIMKRICPFCLLLIFLVGWVVPAMYAQDDWYNQQTAEDSTKTVAADTTEAADTTHVEAVDTTTGKTKEAGAESEVAAPSPQMLIGRAHQWMLRLLYRGKLDASHIGAYSRYQLTAWDATAGSFGPVEARIGVYYLGQTEWEGKDAEWLQAVYETMEDDPQQIEYDIIAARQGEKLQIDRILYRVDGGELQTLEVSVMAKQANVDASDRPMNDGAEQLDLYFGTFDTDKYVGAGLAGEEVIMYRNADVKPLNLVRLAYGDEALTLTDQGSDARPRFYVPPPPRSE
jgi:hypothetical protein